MEADALSPVGLGLLLLPFLVTLLAALCVRCRELPSKWGALWNWMLGAPLDPHTLPSPCTLLTVPTQPWSGVSLVHTDPDSLTVFLPASYDSASTER